MIVSKNYFSYILRIDATSVSTLKPPSFLGSGHTLRAEKYTIIAFNFSIQAIQARMGGWLLNERKYV